MKTWVCDGGFGVKHSPEGQQIQQDRGHRARHAHPNGKRWGRLMKGLMGV